MEIMIAALILFSGAIGIYYYANHLINKAKHTARDIQLKTIRGLQEESEAQREKINALEREYQRKFYNLQFEYKEKEGENLENLNQQLQNLALELIEYRTQQQQKIERELINFQNERVRELICNLDADLISIQEDYAAKINNIQTDAELTISEINTALELLKRQEQAAIQARIREYEEVNQEEFYRINISISDQVEIIELQNVMMKLRNPTVLKKAIFEYYYRNPINDMINRITQGRRITGVYKITHIDSGQCYIGQSVDIGKRFMQHCKRGLGIEERTQIKLYQAIEKYSLHNFKFEIVEEVEENNLSKQEKYWAEYFGAQTFGFSMRN